MKSRKLETVQLSSDKAAINASKSHEANTKQHCLLMLGVLEELMAMGYEKADKSKPT